VLLQIKQLSDLESYIIFVCLRLINFELF